MFDLQWEVDQLPQAMALQTILCGRDLERWQVESLRDNYDVEQFPPRLRDYVVNYPASRMHSTRGRKRSVRTCASERKDMTQLVTYYMLMLAASAVPKRDGAPHEWAADTLMRDEGRNNTRGSFLNRISNLRYYVAMRGFWKFVIDEYGEQLARELVPVINPDGDAFRKKLVAMSLHADEAWAIVREHRRSL